MIKVLEIKKNLTEDEMFDEVCVTEVKFSKENKEYYVTTFKADETIDIYVTENEDVYKSLCVENFFADDYSFQDKLKKISLECYFEIADVWDDGSAKSIYFKEINYCLYKMEQFMNEEDNTNVIENENLEEIDFIVPDYVTCIPEDEMMLLQEYQVCKCNGPKLIDIQYYDEDEGITTEQIEVYDQEENNLCFNFNLFTLTNEQLNHIKNLIEKSSLKGDKDKGVAFMLEKDSLFLLSHSEGDKDIYEQIFQKEAHKLIYDVAKYLNDLGHEIHDILEATGWSVSTDNTTVIADAEDSLTDKIEIKREQLIEEIKTLIAQNKYDEGDPEDYLIDLAQNVAGCLEDKYGSDTEYSDFIDIVNKVIYKD